MEYYEIKFDSCRQPTEHSAYAIAQGSKTGSIPSENIHLAKNIRAGTGRYRFQNIHAIIEIVLAASRNKDS